MRIADIPEPCPYKTSSMTRVDGGHHCSKCDKVVIDFRDKSDQEIIDILRSRIGMDTCGTFKPSQVIQRRKVPFSVLRFAASLLLVFGAFLFTGCGGEEEVDGGICANPDHLDSIEAAMKLKADSTTLADSVADAEYEHYMDSADKANDR